MTYPAAMRIHDEVLVLMATADEIVVWVSSDPADLAPAQRQLAAEGYTVHDARRATDIATAALRAYVLNQMRAAELLSHKNHPWPTEIGLPGERTPLPKDEDRWH